VKIGLNVGSGQRPFKSQMDVIQWINVDSQARWNPDIVCSGDSLPYQDNHADYFVLHHVLEHFGCGEAASLIRESYRVLKPGGRLIACVPDMEALARGWLAGKISTQIYLTNVYGAYMGSEDDRHKFGFDAPSLAEFIDKNAKWSQVRFHRPENDPEGSSIAHDWWILEVEAIK